MRADLLKLGQNTEANRKGRCHMHALGNDTAQKPNFKTNMFAQLNIHVMYQFLNSTKRKIAWAVDRHRGAPKQEAAPYKTKERMFKEKDAIP